jgi:hypothetical protein
MEHMTNTNLLILIKFFIAIKTEFRHQPENKTQMPTMYALPKQLRGIVWVQ